MTWLLAAYLLGLLYFTANPDKVSNKETFRIAWIWFALIPIANFVFALFRAGNAGIAKDLLLVEIWSNGIAWLLLGISFFIFINALMPDDSEDEEPDDEPDSK